VFTAPPATTMFARSPSRTLLMFGIDQLTRAVRALSERVENKIEELACAVGSNSDIVDGLRAAVNTLTERVERMESSTMADLQSLSDALDAQGQDIQQEAQEVKSRLDELGALVQQLQQNQNDPAQVQALADKIEANRSAIRSIFTGEPTPAPEPIPEPAPPSPAPERRR